MKRWNELVVIAAAAAALAVGSVSAQAATSAVERREAQQWERFREGVRSGRLNRAEARRILRGQRHMQRMESRFGRDGFYGARERMRMHRALDRESARIWRLKHNGRYRQVM